MNTLAPAKTPSAESLEGDLIQPGHRLFGLVWVNPHRMSGTPCFTSTRVPVRTMFEYIEGGHSLDDFLEGFPGVNREQAIAVLEAAAMGLLDNLGKR